MKKMIVTLSFIATSFFAFAMLSHEGDQAKIKAAVITFAESADTQNAQAMEKILHKEYRTVANRLFGAEEVSVINKPTYLTLLKEGKLGGDEREVKIEEILVSGNNAVVKVVLTGKVLIFHSFVQLVKDSEGVWTIISDFPKIEKV